jgi:metallo-beta-lactamase family protein
VLHHLKRFLPDRANSILLVGFQAAGTRGRALLDGVEEIKIHGEYYPVRARVAQIESLSAHADWAELLDWLEASDLGSVRAFVNHGEPAASDAMRRRLVERFGWDVTVAEHGGSFEI